MAAVRIANLTRQFGSNVILRDISLTVQDAEFVSLLGRSGSGKTTLLRTLAGLDPAPGEIGDIPERRAVVFQEPRLLPWKKVWQNVSLGLDGENIRAQAVAALGEVELGHRVDAWPLTLSGGEAQRAALARAIVRKPELLLLDEPFASLDALTRIRMQSLVLSLWKVYRPSVLMVTHDVDEALALSDRILLLADGQIALDIKVDLPRPRSVRNPGYLDLRQHLLAKLGVNIEAETD